MDGTPSAENRTDTGGAPTTAIVSLAATRDVYLVELDDAHIAKLIEASNASYLSSPSQQKAEKARNYILQNLTQNELRLGAISKDAQVSEVYLRKLFHACYGVSPNQYITNARLQYAKELMQEPDLTLEDIALQCGFSSLSYFCRVFKEAEGISAGEFRKDLIKSDS